MLDALLLVSVGAGFLIVGNTIRKVAKRAQFLSKAPTYSKNVDYAAVESGIYVEHGMIDRSSGSSIIAPQQKKSEAYYSALL